jgi:S1-C subfamily serine protease
MNVIAQILGRSDLFPAVSVGSGVCPSVARPLLLSLVMKSLEDIYEIARVFDGIPVLSCSPGSPAHIAGIRYGDILLRVNGHQTRTLSAYAEARSTAPARVPVTILRDGEEMDLVMELRNAEISDAETMLAQVVEQRMFAATRRALTRSC